MIEPSEIDMPMIAAHLTVAFFTCQDLNGLSKRRVFAIYKAFNEALEKGGEELIDQPEEG